MEDLTKIYWAIELARALRGESQALREQAEDVMAESRQLCNSVTAAGKATPPTERALPSPVNHRPSSEKTIVVE